MSLNTSAAPDAEFTQLAMIHELPRARVVDRLDHLVDLARGRRVIHVGFVDTGCTEMQAAAGTWLHSRLAAVATSLVGIDVNAAGVAAAVADGYEAYAVDCRDAAAVAALQIQPGDLVIAGEVIEHLDDPGAFLDGLHALCAPTGRLVVTTPNATGWFNSLAALVGREINHPDHVVMFTWRTLTTLAGRHGWTPVASATFVPEVKDFASAGLGARLLAFVARATVALERLLGRLGRAFVADGMIVEFESTR
jgi:2-polyprenyl-3-methyl-5-hydroxy-6-metoxy-1,4-benzoquinol methylase